MYLLFLLDLKQVSRPLALESYTLFETSSFFLKNTPGNKSER